MQIRSLSRLFLLLVSLPVSMTSFATEPAAETDGFSPDDRRAWVMSTFLTELESSSWLFYNVPPSDGRFLYEFMRSTKRKRALEFGSANGYSAIWIGLGLAENKGKLDTVEIDKNRAELCRKNIEKAGLRSVVNCINGDALKISESLAGKYDFFFIDLGVMDMLPFLKSVESKLTDDAIIALHNLAFEDSYQSLLVYVEEKGWKVDKRLPEEGEGYGFFLIRK